MHLVELLSRRAVPAAGVSLGITRRCPLTCSHCSTSSTMQSEQSPSGMFTKFVDTFTPNSRPDVIAMSGGEALLRPKLVRTLALQARAVGTRSSVLSGMFFARQEKIPPSIKAAIDAVDHFSISIDAFHEREVPRVGVFRVLRQLLDEGKPISMHIAGEHIDDPYLDDIVGDVKKNFGQRIPMLVNTLSSFGRAKSFLKQGLPGTFQEEGTPPNPCTMAAWPVVGFDGVVAACGNDNLIGNVPLHLRLGNAHTDSWQTIAQRCQQAAMLKALRVFGPQYIQSQFGLSAKTNQPAAATVCKGYCDTCIHMQQDPAIPLHVKKHVEKTSFSVLEQQVIDFQTEQGPIAFAGRYSHPRFADLVMLGAPQCA